MTVTQLIQYIKQNVTEKIFTANIEIQVLSTILLQLVNKPGGASMFRFSLTQAATDAPTIVTFFNSLGATITPARTSAGVYTLTADKAVFTADKTILPNTIAIYSAGVLAKTISFARTSTTVVTATVKDLTNASVDLVGTVNDISIQVTE